MLTNHWLSLGQITMYLSTSTIGSRLSHRGVMAKLNTCGWKVHGWWISCGELGFDCQQSGYNLLSANTPQEVNASYEHHTFLRYVMSPPFAYGIWMSYIWKFWDLEIAWIFNFYFAFCVHSSHLQVVGFQFWVFITVIWFWAQGWAVKMQDSASYNLLVAASY